MSGPANWSSLRIAFVSGSLLIILLLTLLYFSHRNRDSGPELTETTVAPAEASVEDAAVQRPNEGRILAECQPHLNGNPSVPNFEVGNRPNASSTLLRVRFWVNGDGFVTQAFLTGANFVSAGDREEALHYVKGLTFSVPNTAECRTRQMELLGSFLQSHSSAGEWSTLFEVHPRYTVDGNRVVQNR